MTIYFCKWPHLEIILFDYLFLLMTTNRKYVSSFYYMYPAGIMRLKLIINLESIWIVGYQVNGKEWSIASFPITYQKQIDKITTQKGSIW